MPTVGWPKIFQNKDGKGLTLKKTNKGVAEDSHLRTKKSFSIIILLYKQPESFMRVGWYVGLLILYKLFEINRIG